MALLCINDEIEETFNTYAKSKYVAMDLQDLKVEGGEKKVRDSYIIKAKFICSNACCENMWTSKRGILQLNVAKGSASKPIDNDNDHNNHNESESEKLEDLRYFDIYVWNQKCRRCDEWSVDYHLYEEDKRPIVDACLALMSDVSLEQKPRRTVGKKGTPHDKSRCAACQRGKSH